MRGFTLLELLVVLAVLALALGLTGLAWRSTGAVPAAEPVRALEAARATAVREGRMTTWTDSATTIRFWPDGSASGGVLVVDGITVTIEPLEGTIRAQR